MHRSHLPPSQQRIIRFKISILLLLRNSILIRCPRVTGPKLSNTEHLRYLAYGMVWVEKYVLEGTLLQIHIWTNLPIVLKKLVKQIILQAVVSYLVMLNNINRWFYIIEQPNFLNCRECVSKIWSHGLCKIILLWRYFEMVYKKQWTH